MERRSSRGARSKPPHGATARNDSTKIASREQAIEHLLDTLWTGETQVVSSPSEIDVVGHRIVNGGQEYRQPTLITPEVKAAIAQHVRVCAAA